MKRLLLAISIVCTTASFSFASVSTFYSSSGSGSLDTDGYFYSNFAPTMVDLHSTTTSQAVVSTSTYINVTTGNTINGYYSSRSYIGFYVQSLLATTTVIDSAKLVFRKNGAQYFNDSNASVQITGFLSSSNTPPVTEFSNFTMSELSSPVPFSNFSTSSSTEISLNSAGISYINSFTNGGYIRFGVLTSFDILTQSIPNNNLNILLLNSADSGASVPYLEVVWHVGNPNASTTNGIGGFATSTSITCNIFDYSNFSVSGCVSYLFIPSEQDMTDIMNNARTTVLSKAPIGYVNRMYTIWSDTGTSSLPTVSVSIPTGVGTHETVTANFGDMLSGGVAELNSIVSPVNNKSARDVLEPMVKLLVAIGVIFTIVTDIMGSHKHNNNIA